MCTLSVHSVFVIRNTPLRVPVLYLLHLSSFMTNRPKILLLIPHPGGGGAEQVAAHLARGLSREKYEVHLGLVTGTGAGSVLLPPWVCVHALGASRLRAGTRRLLKLVRRLKPDLIISGMAHLNFLVLMLRPFFPAGTRVLVRQNGTISAALAFGDLPAYTSVLYRVLYRFADGVICQTHAMAEDLIRETGVSAKRVAVLPNPIDVDGIRAAAREPNSWRGPGPHLLAVGRLAPVKGFDLLLRAMAMVHDRFPNADLLIAGAGAEEAALIRLSVELGLERAVRFAGEVSRPWAYFAGASLFVLSSRHEGLPNALLEAAAGGLPIVATPASQGLVDLLRGQPGVWIAQATTAEALTRSILSALHSLSPGQRFPHPFIEQFSLTRSIQAYERLIDTRLKERRR